MKTPSRNDLLLAAAMLACLGGFALADETLWRATAAVLGGFAVAAHILLGDEVERARHKGAAAFAFAVLVLAALALTAAGRSDLIAAHADRLWAIGFAAFLAGWGGLRLTRA